MAQHIKLFEKDEPKVFRSLKRIVSYLVRPYVWSGVPVNEPYHVYGKEILTDKNNAHIEHIISVRYYTLENKRWDERKIGGMDLRKDVILEVRFTLMGEIVAVYYPV